MKMMIVSGRGVRTGIEDDGSVRRSVGMRNEDDGSIMTRHQDGQ
jgi:hypothetical protein